MSPEKEREVVERGAAEKGAGRILSAGVKASKTGQVSWGGASDPEHLVHMERRVVAVVGAAGEGEGSDVWIP